MSPHVEATELDSVAAHMRRWRATHARATLTEIERELDRRWAMVRATLLAEVAPSAAAEPLAPCPDCGGRLVRRGTQERTLRTSGDELLSRTRPYATCTRCGRGLSPPWMNGSGSCRAATSPRCWSMALAGASR